MIFEEYNKMANRRNRGLARLVALDGTPLAEPNSNGNGTGHQDDEHSLEALVGMAQDGQKRIDTKRILHMQSYLNAAELLLGEDGLYDFKRLNDESVRDNFGREMIDFYVTKAASALHSDLTKLAWHERNNLVTAYFGFREHDLMEALNQRRAAFPDYFETRFVPSLGQQELQGYQLSLSSRIREGDMPTIIDNLGLKGRIDPGKIRTEELAPMVYSFATQGAVPPDMYNGALYDLAKPAAPSANGHGSAHN